MHPFIPNTDVPRGRWLSVAVLLAGLCVVHAAGKDHTRRHAPDRTIPLEADVTDASPNAGLVPTVAPQAPAPVPEAWPSGTGFEEMLGLRTACPCVEAGAWVIQFGLANAFRGNVYTIDPEGSARTLCDFCQELDVPPDA